MVFAGGGIPPGVGKAIFAKSAYREAICGQKCLCNRSQVYNPILSKAVSDHG